MRLLDSSFLTVEERIAFVIGDGEHQLSAKLVNPIDDALS